jgi:hypothetical protein
MMAGGDWLTASEKVALIEAISKTDRDEMISFAVFERARWSISKSLFGVFHENIGTGGDFAVTGGALTEGVPLSL